MAPLTAEVRQPGLRSFYLLETPVQTTALAVRHRRLLRFAERALLAAGTFLFLVYGVARLQVP
jgi:hypothetical protein